MLLNTCDHYHASVKMDRVVMLHDVYQAGCVPLLEDPALQGVCAGRDALAWWNARYSHGPLSLREYWRGFKED